MEERKIETHLRLARAAVTCFELPEDVVGVPSPQHAPDERPCAVRMSHNRVDKDSMVDCETHQRRRITARDRS